MNVLITGSNGFVAKNLIRNLSEYNLTITNRESLNLLDQNIVKNFFKNKYFDVVINTATSGGSRLKIDGIEVFFENCLMHQNLLDNSNSFDKYISFGSGAELDRRYNVNHSTDLRSAHPIDPYGMSKNLIAKSGILYPKFHNLRIFNVFNETELDTRMIKSNIYNYINKKPIIIHQDRFMDFFYMDDLIQVVKFVINSNLEQKIINCAYFEKFLLSDIAKIINNLSDYKVEVIVQNETQGLDYIGDYNLHLFDINLTGLQNGIMKTYAAIINKEIS